MSYREIGLGSYVHVLNRGAKKMPIYRQESDLWRLLHSLFYLNSELVPENWARVLGDDMAHMIWPETWPERKPLVSILAFTIMKNHMHFVLKEIQEGGISRFMHKISMAHSKFINAKYKETGSLFQGGFKSVVVETETYLRYLAVYVMVKNPFELYPVGGLEGAMQNFDAAWEWALRYPFTSLSDYATTNRSPIIDRDILGEIFESPEEFKAFARDCILGRKFDESIFEDRP